MKAEMKGIMISGTILVAVLFANIPMASAVQYLGEFCWSIHITASDKGPRDETYIERTRITQLSNNAFSVDGVVEVPGDNPVISQGAGTVIGNDLFITSNSTQEHSTSPYRDIGTAQSRVNLSSLSGTLWAISRSYNTSTRLFSDFYSSGTITLTSCP